MQYKKSSRIYLDNNATTPIAKSSLEAMTEAYKHMWGNPAGFYMEGTHAKKALDWSRKVFADILEVPPKTVYFTSCGTESNNIALRSVMTDCAHAKNGRDIIVTSSVEHSSIRRTAESCGFKHIQVPVDRKGYVDTEAYRRILKQNSRHIGMISIIMGQNEVGTIQRITGLVRMAREILGPNVPFHSDATQMLGKYIVNPERLGLDLMTASAHKFHGPRGVGILYAREGVIKPSLTTMTGGGQERGCRSGTENVPAIFAAANALHDMVGDRGKWEVRAASVKTMRDTMLESLRRAVPNIVVNGDPYNGLYNTISISFPGAQGYLMCEYADKLDLAIGAGSACSKGKTSETLRAIYGDSETSDKIVQGTIRISLSHLNTPSQCAKAVDIIIRSWRATNSSTESVY